MSASGSFVAAAGNSEVTASLFLASTISPGIYFERVAYNLNSSSAVFILDPL